MSQDDVERVARAILRVRVQGFNLGWDDSGGRSVIEYGREMARAAFSAMPPRDELLREALEALTKTPLIEAITPTSKEWRTCETVQDTYDLMKHRIRAAADKIRAALDKGEPQP